MKGNKRRMIIALPILILLFWLSMVITDFTLSTHAKAPFFARQIDAYDADIYRGIGYTIVIDDGYAVSPPDAELKGFFYWGWR